MEETQNTPMDLLNVVWSRKWAILLFTSVVTGTAVIVSAFIPKQYESKATILVSPPKFNVEQQMASLSIDSYRDLAVTSGILQGVIDRLVPKYPNIKSSLYPKTLEGMLRINTGSTKFEGGGI